MPKISFVKNRPPIDTPGGQSLMDVLISSGLPVASSCGGEGVCTKCKIRIQTGSQYLSPETTLEKDLREIHDIPKDERVSCQTIILTEPSGEIVVDTRYW